MLIQSRNSIKKLDIGKLFAKESHDESSDLSFPITTIGILLVPLNKLMGYFAFPTPSKYPDSESYLPESLFDFSQVSVFGNANRPWPITLTYSLLSSSTSIFIFQMLFSTLCWSFLLITSKKHFHSSKFFKPAQVSLIVLALTPQINQWDSVLLAPSITISLLVLTVAFLIRFKNVEPLGLLDRSSFLVLALLVGSLKVTNLPIVLLIGFLLVQSCKKIASRKLRLIQTVMVIFVISFVSIVGFNTNKHWEASYSGTTLMWQLGEQSPVTSDYSNFLETRTRAPECLFEDAPFKDPGVAFNSKSQNCKEFSEYLKHEMSTDFIRFLISNPRAIVQSIATGVGAILSGAGSHYGNSFSLLPKPVSEIYFGSTSPTFTELGISDQSSGSSLLESTTGFWLFGPSFLVATLLIISSMVCYLRKRVRPAWPITAGILVMTFQLVISIVLLPSEWFRQTIPFITAIFILGWIHLMDSSNKSHS